jgi:transposase
MTRIDELPDDPILLKRLVLAQEVRLAEREAILAQRDVLIERIREEASDQLAARDTIIERMETEHKAAIAAILRRFYGPRSERFDPHQLLLFGQQVEQVGADLANSAAEFDAEPEPVVRRKKNRHKHGRSPLPAHLPRIEIEHDLADAEKPCPCCGEIRARIGQEVSEQLEYLPASFKVLKHIQHKYACQRCEADASSPQIVTAAKPLQPIPKGLPGPGLLAYLITSKSADHLPLYRLERIFARLQVHVARTTMCGWLAACGELVRPLVERMTWRILASKVIHTDDTRVPVQTPGDRTCKSGRIWTYIGDASHPYIVYDYTADRKRAGPANWLRDFTGYLQADAYGGYDGIYHSGAREVACWAHARRKFFEAKDTDSRRSAQMLTWVQELYAIEREAKDATDGERRALRQARSAPILERIKTWLDVETQIVLPRSEMGQAIGYTLNQWAALNLYVTEGFLNIDNNAAERALKRVAIGRKNWLFAGNDYAGGTAARLYSLVASAERHEIDPQRYLTSVLAKLPFTSESDLDQFLPDVWKRDDAAEPMPTPN